MHEMTTTWNYGIVALSVITAVIGSYVALHLAERLRASQVAHERIFWAILGALTMGLAIWSMHFVGMLAMTMDMPMGYDPFLSFMSMVAAAIGAGIAFVILQRPTIDRIHYIFGSLSMGMAISTMHYTGMASMRMAAKIVYDPPLFLLSVVVAIVASAGALWLAFRPARGSTAAILTRKIGSAIVMGIAISGMHYTGMASAHYLHSGTFIGEINRPTVGPFLLSDLLIAALVAFGVALIVLSAHAMAERQKMLEELKASESMFRTMADTAPVLIWKAGPDGLYFYFNKPWRDFTGRSLAQEMGNGWMEGIHPHDVDTCSDTHQVFFEARQPFEMEYRLRQHDGEYRWLLNKGTPLFHENGDFMGYIGSCIDIHDRKLSEHELQKTTRDLMISERSSRMYARKLEKSNQELEQFATIASHDLQAPVRKIQIFSTALRQTLDDTLSEEAGDYLNRIQRSTHRMQELITDLLTLSRVNRKGAPFRPTELNVVLAEALDELDLLRMESNGTVEVLNPLPRLDADERQMRQVFINLIGNALKFHKPEIAPIVRIRCEVGESICTITVEDNGIGFKPEYAERIFQIFERLHGESVYPGTGIGLAIVQKVVERHQGTVTAQGRPGEGATFSITLPLAQSAAEELGDDISTEAPTTEGETREAGTRQEDLPHRR